MITEVAVYSMVWYIRDGYYCQSYECTYGYILVKRMHCARMLAEPR